MSIVKCSNHIKLNWDEGATCLPKMEEAKPWPQRKLQQLIKDQRKGNVVLLHVLIKAAEGISLGNMVQDNRMLMISLLLLLLLWYWPEQKNKCFIRLEGKKKRQRPKVLGVILAAGFDHLAPTLSAVLVRLPWSHLPKQITPRKQTLRGSVQTD